MSIVIQPGGIYAYRCDSTDLIVTRLPKSWKTVRTYHGGGVYVTRHYAPGAKVD